MRAFNTEDFKGAGEFWSQFAIFVEKIETFKQDKLPLVVVVMSSLFVKVFFLLISRRKVVSEQRRVLEPPEFVKKSHPLGWPGSGDGEDQVRRRRGAGLQGRR